MKSSASIAIDIVFSWLNNPLASYIAESPTGFSRYMTLARDIAKAIDSERGQKVEYVSDETILWQIETHWDRIKPSFISYAQSHME